MLNQLRELIRSKTLVIACFKPVDFDLFKLIETDQIIIKRVEFDAVEMGGHFR